MISITNYWLFKYIYRFKGTTGTDVQNLLLFKHGVILLFRSPGVPLKRGSILYLSASKKGVYLAEHTRTPFQWECPPWEIASPPRSHVGSLSGFRSRSQTQEKGRHTPIENSNDWREWTKVDVESSHFLSAISKMSAIF